LECWSGGVMEGWARCWMPDAGCWMRPPHPLLRQKHFGGRAGPVPQRQRRNPPRHLGGYKRFATKWETKFPTKVPTKFEDCWSGLAARTG